METPCHKKSDKDRVDKIAQKRMRKFTRKCYYKNKLDINRYYGNMHEIKK